ncbi:meiosis-specific with OB domain-containing protein-like [Xenia sp. Carnegie-2017]|uniref:meiosis-specific with OB domain-containing protein-like n=1 Tax=Xenia sp. Carnegie-2017 TaxID=2897299 RepID=UPI001F04D0A2|nr:meiosis-specific with OB domain-containing protein-like [Xenia sp. Carnegie-2017]
MDFGSRNYWPDGTPVEKPTETASDRHFIKDLVPGSANKIIIGVVISKLSIHSFPDKKNPGSTRYTLGFTLRDTPFDYVNITCWGNAIFINNLNESFKLSDVVEVRNPQVSTKQGNDYEQQWKPWTPCNIQLNISEAYSSVSLYSGWDMTDLNTLLHIPVKECGDYCTLDDILSSGENSHGDHMNILVAIRKVSQPREITTRRGKHVQKCDVVVFDETCNSFLMTIWDENTIDMAMSWIPCETVLFFSDLKIIYDQYKKTMASVCNNRTIITMNPDTKQAHQLYSYAQSSDVQGAILSDTGDFSLFDLEGITDVYTIENVKENLFCGHMSETPNLYDNSQGILFAYITKFNIDEEMDNFLITRCGRCKRRIDNATNACENEMCSKQGNSAAQLSYNLLVDVSDHNGTINNCRIMTSALESMLGYPPDQFEQLPSAVVTDIKMKYLLEKCKIYFRISKNAHSNFVLILSCDTAEPEEAYGNIK